MGYPRRPASCIKSIERTALAWLIMFEHGLLTVYRFSARAPLYIIPSLCDHKITTCTKCEEVPTTTRRLGRDFSSTVFHYALVNMKHAFDYCVSPP